MYQIFRKTVRIATLHKRRCIYLALFIIAAPFTQQTQLVAQPPCPTEYSQGSDESVESAIKGTLRYHEWSIGVLEEVTTSVSSRFKRPDGSDDKSLSVDFDVVTGGAIDGLKVIQSSGDPSFDDEFLQAILFLAPFSIDGDYMTECAIAGLAISIKWANGGSFTEIRNDVQQ